MAEENTNLLKIEFIEQHLQCEEDTFTASSPESVLEEICTEFREGILNGGTSLDMCFAVCAPLQSYLEMCGYQTELVMGYVGSGNHYWLRLPDGTIIDPTADQFNYLLKKRNKMPPVYIGDKPDWYRLDEAS